MPAKPRKIVPAQGEVAIANHCAIVNLLRVVILLRHRIFSTAGSFGQKRDMESGDFLTREHEKKAIPYPQPFHTPTRLPPS